MREIKKRLYIDLELFQWWWSFGLPVRTSGLSIEQWFNEVIKKQNIITFFFLFSIGSTLCLVTFLTGLNHHQSDPYLFLSLAFGPKIWTEPRLFSFGFRFLFILANFFTSTFSRQSQLESCSFLSPSIAFLL